MVVKSNVFSLRELCTRVGVSTCLVTLSVLWMRTQELIFLCTHPNSRLCSAMLGDVAAFDLLLDNIDLQNLEIVGANSLHVTIDESKDHNLKIVETIYITGFR